LATRVAFLLPNLNGGGAERAVLELAAESRLECTILTERPGGDLSHHPLATAVQCLDVAGGRLVRATRLAGAVRARRIDVLVSVLSPVVVAAAGQSQRVPVITWIQNPLPEVVRPVPESGRPQVRDRVARLIGAASAAVAGTAPGIRDEWRRAGLPDDRTCVLPNGTRLPECVRRQRTDGRELRLLSVGRLVPQKRHDLAITALADLRSGGCPASLEILGRGTAEGPLRTLAARLGIAEHVTFAGFVSDPSPRYGAADVFVLTSDFEGFGNVLVEALAHELPVVATDAPYGPRFILGGLRGARLVDRGSSAAVAQAIREVVGEWRASPSLALAARQRACAFAVGRTAAHFDLIVDAVLARGPLPQWSIGGLTGG
jgi:glycosyltransferase involved in cell wall biosynthesis